MKKKPSGWIRGNGKSISSQVEAVQADAINEDEFELDLSALLAADPGADDDGNGDVAVGSEVEGSAEPAAESDSSADAPSEEAEADSEGEPQPTDADGAPIPTPDATPDATPAPDAPEAQAETSGEVDVEPELGVMPDGELAEGGRSRLK